MEKQLTPIQKTIAWCDEQLLKSDGAYQPFLINVKAKLITLLQEEKQFALDAYNQGITDETDTAHFTSDFSDYYKQYERD